MDWKPTRVDEKNELALHGDTFAEISEGNTIFVSQDNWQEKRQYVALMKEDIYNLVFNFFSIEEMTELGNVMGEAIKERVKERKIL